MSQNVLLSQNGPVFSRIVLGVMKWGVWGKKLDTQEMLRLIEFGLELGITTFDHADIYGHYTTEAEFGAALKLKPSLRQEMQLVTKCGIKLVTPNRPHHLLKSYDTSIEHLTWSVEQSLKNLNTDHLDLLLIHRPDPLLNPEDVADIFTSLKTQGKVLQFGVSNFTPSQFALLNTYIPLVTNQIEASVVHLEPFLDGTLDQCMQHRIKPMAWSPVGGSELFEKSEDARIRRVQTAAQAIADEREGATPDQVLLAWLLMHPSGMLPVIGTTQPERIRAACRAQDVHLTREEWFELWSASTGGEVA
jgi:predicted oxidoreductase